MLTHVLFSMFHMMPGHDVRSLLPHSVHGKLLHHRCCGPPQGQEQESETKESVIHTIIIKITHTQHFYKILSHMLLSKFKAHIIIIAIIDIICCVIMLSNNYKSWLSLQNMCRRRKVSCLINHH